tara:strand:+ start:1505 stop:2842 length:1338 start_codon:yes stop_codon:yes gene_type:complete
VKYEDLKLDQLSVNRANDRHGELVDEDAAIEWLLTHRANHMRNLAKDIVSAGEIYEPPLVRKEGDVFVVYDGNRRTTALKLLAKPQRAMSADWARFFRTLRDQWDGDFPTSVTCQIEQDRERLDEILYRRHTGQQSGVGQSQWDAPAKTNFERRTGKNTKIDIAEVIEKLLRDEGHLSEADRIPRSNMKRLFSAEQFRNRVGISLEKNKLNFTHDPEKVLAALSRIANDLISKTVTLDDLWDNKAKRKYLDDLDNQGVLPRIEDTLSEKTPTGPGKHKPSSKPPAVPEPKLPKSTPAEKRRTLIRNIDHGLRQTQPNRRALDIFDELQHRLKFEDHDNAIAVLFRVLLEIGIDLYISEWSVQNVHSGDRLANKFRKTIDAMHTSGAIDKKYSDALKRFERTEVLFSTSTLHAYVHSAEFFPSDHHLKSMWDTLEHFVVLCLQPKP